jgi:poly(beta-D-mannuronate) lyase
MTNRALFRRRSPGVTRISLAISAVFVATVGCGGPAPSGPIAGPAPAVPATPAAPAPDPANRVPGDVLDLRDWYLTLPTGPPEDPDTVHQPRLATYSGTHFRLDDARTGVVFSANAGGATTKGSSYPRSELREMDGTDEASWSNRAGTHTLAVRQAVMALPPVKPEVVVAQIHDAEDDVLLVRCEGSRLLVQWEDGDREVVLDPAYRLGTPYELRIVAAGGRVEIFYDGVRAAEVPKSGSGWYFKAGAYVQSNVEKGEDAGALGEVVVQQLSVEHSL